MQQSFSGVEVYTYVSDFAFSSGRVSYLEFLILDSHVPKSPKSSFFLPQPAMVPQLRVSAHGVLLPLQFPNTL